MTSKKRVSKLVHEGSYVAQVEVELIYTHEGWSPYLSLDDAQRLDDVRESLRRGEIEAAQPGVQQRAGSRIGAIWKVRPDMKACACDIAGG
ncbi:MAG: hypothetical protein FJ026_08260 [Chloroflexi bacterium]|nr:hypothetical protein [Chloroflexota bacterium]